MNKGKIIFLVIFSLALSTILVVLDSTKNTYYGAKEVYRVYLKGKSLGLIESKSELENYIDNEAEAIKNEYNINKVYAPTGLEIKEEITYNDKIITTKDIYEEIKNEQDFTIDGYRVTINHKNKTESKDEETISAPKEKEYLYLLDKNILKEAIDTTVLSFVDEEKYKDYLNENQQEIVDEGTIIENVYIDEEISIKKDLIPVNQKIFRDSKELAQYLLFGTTENQTIYTVKDGDTVASIANSNKLNTRELLTANTNLASENSLLYIGQQLVVSLIDPVITVVEETHTVELQTVKYKTEIEEDKNYYYGYSEVVREGVDGQNLVTKKTKIENGQVTNVINVSTVEVKPAISRIVKTGSRTSLIVSADGIWAWPTRSGYTLTDGYEWRWGKLHAAQDIAGLGCNSPIYAANDGTVTQVHHWGGGTGGLDSLGNYVEITHANGYVTGYAHLSNVYVKQGESILMGTVLGTMGETGFSYGCHLHFVAKYRGQTFNPMQLYR